MTAYQRLPSAPFSPVPGRGAPDADTSRSVAAYDLSWIDPQGKALWDCRRLPDTPEVEGAIATLARGAMLQGRRGPLAIEDLIPGDRVATRDGGTAQIDWVGSRTYTSQSERPMFYRVSANAFGASGPSTSVVVGAQAHILIEHRRCHELVGGPVAFAPISAFENGHSVSAIVPPGEVTVYGFACAGQEAVIVSGLPVESYHPARATARTLTAGVLSDMAKLFPHLEGGTGFGAPRIPHLSRAEAQSLSITGI